MRWCRVGMLRALPWLAMITLVVATLGPPATMQAQAGTLSLVYLNAERPGANGTMIGFATLP